MSLFFSDSPKIIHCLTLNVVVHTCVLLAIYAYVLSTGVLLHDTSDLLWIICTYLCLNISSKRPSKHDTIEPMSAECRGISAMTYRCRTDVMSLMLVICIIIILLCFDNTRRLSMFTLLLFQLLFVNIKSSYRGESNGSTCTSVLTHRLGSP